MLRGNVNDDLVKKLDAGEQKKRATEVALFKEYLKKISCEVEERDNYRYRALGPTCASRVSDV